MSTPFKLTQGRIGSASTEHQALEKCLSDKRCVGVTQHTRNYFTLHNSLEYVEVQGSQVYIRRGSQISGAGYLWGYMRGWEFRGYDSNTKYTTSSAAFTACTASRTCKGKLG